MVEEGKDVRLVIDNVHDGRAWLIDGVVAFRPNGRGRPEGAKRALIDGAQVSIATPVASKLAKGAYEARIEA